MKRLSSQNQQIFFYIVCSKMVIILLFLSVEVFASEEVRKMTENEYKSMTELWQDARNKCGLGDWKSFFNWDFPVSDLYVSSMPCDVKTAAGCYKNNSISIRNDFVFSNDDRKKLDELRKKATLCDDEIEKYKELLLKKITVIHEMMHAYSYDKYPMYIGEAQLLNHRCLNEGFATTMTFFAIQDDLEILSKACQKTPEDVYRDLLVVPDYKIAFNGFMYAVRLRSEEEPSAKNTKQVLDELNKDKERFASLAEGLGGYFKDNRKDIETSKWYTQDPRYKNNSEDLQGNAITDNGEKFNNDNFIAGDNVTDNGTFSDGEAVENGDSVYQSSYAYQVLLNGGVNDQTVENGDLVCQPSDNNYITDEGNNGNPGDAGNIVAGWSGIGKVVDAALDEAAIVKPTISHKRILWLFSGESMWDSFKSTGKSLAKNIDLSELRKNFSDMWKKVAGKGDSNMSDIKSGIDLVKPYLEEK